MTGTRNTLAIRKPVTGSAAEGLGTADHDGAQSEPVGEQDGDGAPGAAGGHAMSAAMKAKKRRVGGVNIFPGMRKVSCHAHFWQALRH